MRMSGTMIGVIVSVLMAAEAAPAFPGESYVQYGAFGILAFIVIWTMTKTIPSMSSTVKDMIGKHEQSMVELVTSHRVAMVELVTSHKLAIADMIANHRAERKEAWDKLADWERARHEDSKILNETLSEMRTHCRDTVAQIKS